jgi:hypothetical protein
MIGPDLTGPDLTGPDLTGEQMDAFIENGFVHLRDVVAPDVVADGQKIIWSDLGQSPDDPSSWTAPVVRLIPSEAGPFGAAFASPRLHAAFDQLVGERTWLPRADLGYFVVRFPHPTEPDDTGWHIDSSFPPGQNVSEEGDFSQWRINVCSRQRALLMLFLFSDVGPDDAPTRIRTGSHLDVPALLHPAGPSGVSSARPTLWSLMRLAHGPWTWPSVGPETSTCVIRFWSTGRSR